MSIMRYNYLIFHTMPKIITTILLEETNYSWVLTEQDARITPLLQFESKYKVL